jgi:hypothetical protein
MSERDNNDLTAAERELFARLPRTANLNHQHEEMLVAAMRKRRTAAARAVLRRRRSVTIAAATLATAASFALGVAVGRSTSGRETVTPAQPGPDTQRGGRLASQKPDSAYVTLTRIITM